MLRFTNVGKTKSLEHFLHWSQWLYHTVDSSLSCELVHCIVVFIVTIIIINTRYRDPCVSLTHFRPNIDVLHAMNKDFYFFFFVVQMLNCSVAILLRVTHFTFKVC